MCISYDRLPQGGYCTLRNHEALSDPTQGAPLSALSQQERIALSDHSTETPRPASIFFSNKDGKLKEDLLIK